MTKESGGFVKSKAKGLVNYPPFENLDEGSLREIKRYQVYPYGKIQDYCRHIPYNSGKKDFYEKTGRESFEVFQYIFKVPGDGTEYTVMWDYNVGLVRMTPFFKCCKYSKTMPAKMLNMNPGLRDITHSITGGSIMAQGKHSVPNLYNDTPRPQQPLTRPLQATGCPMRVPKPSVRHSARLLPAH